ncbi:MULTISPECIES: hypothetical protein [unclassified Streptomyces]|uniref:hypothetical protein n=1 Tax=unclassified Streptomyces TaxID=2593676 RepID=UPI0004C96B3D|nr:MULTISPECIES: hypothetical protein [unclassified Streptomyces]KOV86091.1 hypothetical protein ADL02_19570 [Streptomyces sp. NRRL WC-3723]
MPHDPQLDLDAIEEDAARTAWLLRQPADQIIRYGPETAAEWLIARSEDRSARLRAACQSLRAAAADEARAIENLRAAVSAAARP